MVRREKIIIMSKLAILDKNNVKKDMKITSHYPEDYIYINNIFTRISLFILISIGCGLHILLNLENEILVPTSAQELFSMYLLPYGSVIVAVLVIYTLLSTYIFRKRYKEAYERVTKYKKLMKRLDELEQTNHEGGEIRGK